MYESVSIDSDHVMYVTDIAREVGVSKMNTHKWIKNHWDELPDPLLILPLRGGGELQVYDEFDAMKIVDAYVKFRER